MAKVLRQVIVMPRNITKWYTVKNEQTNNALKIRLDTFYSEGKASFSTDAVTLENGKLQITTTHRFANEDAYNEYATWWSQYDAERLAYHTEHGITSSSTVTDE